jgi:hypothetical protein
VGVPACPWIYYSHKPVRRRTEGGRRRAGRDIFVWLQVMVGSLFFLSFPCGLLGLGPKIAGAIVGVKMHLLYSFSR